jgi:Ankyrin repeats (3 copies)
VNLGQLRKQAKDLVKAARRGDSEAVARFGDLPVRLSSAHLVLAREHGFSSWPALVHAAEASVGSFVLAATERRRGYAERLLGARPELERDRWVRLVLGLEWEGDANEAGGPRAWSPLHYVCHSAFETTALAGVLLARGADPNAYYANEHGPMSTLYGAAGVKHDPQLTRLLLEHGADPNGEPWFGDALYHSAEAESPECLTLLLEHGARPSGSNALAHALDFGRIEAVQMLLDAGADANEGSALAHAVRRGRRPEFLRLLVERGADLDRPGGEAWRGDVPLRTPYAHAVLRGDDAAAETLRELGASTAVVPTDAAVAAIARGERAVGTLPDELDPDQQEVLVLAALRGNVDVVVDVVGVGFRGVAGGGPAGTLLHHACWVGDADLVGRLLDLGADPIAPSGLLFDTPLAWAFLDSDSWREPGRDFVRVAELLMAAGAELEERFVAVAEGPLAEWLEARI